MSTAGDPLAPDKVARITGGFYLTYILASVLATVLAGIGLGTASQVYQAMMTNEGSFRLGLVIALTSGFLFLMVAWGLYVLLRRVNRDLALLFLLLNAVGVAIQGASMLSLISAMLQGDPASNMQAYSATQLEGLAYLSINVYKAGSRRSCSSARGCSRSATWSTSPGTSPGGWASSSCWTGSPS
jgi:hypothetical protein